MSIELVRRLHGEIERIAHVDPHTHINPLSPASTTLADLLGYHYYTELAHSAGMPKGRIEEPGISAKEKVGRLVEKLGPIENTIQYSWLIELSREFFGFEGDRLTASNWEGLFDAAEAKMGRPRWADEVLEKSKIEGVFLTNDFDDPLAGFDTKKYIPCLRTDDLVFHLGRPEVRERLQSCTKTDVTNAASLRDAIGKLFTHFTANGARACAISLPPDFAPHAVSANEAAEAVRGVLHGRTEATNTRIASNFVFWTLAEYCASHRLPFDLMIGVNRNVYPDGVHQGRDLFDARVSLIQYRDLFNAFPQVTFPVSVLSATSNPELVAYSWIFPNVVTSGHWWYSNTPTPILHDAACRLEAVPQTKQIGYYSDAYKLEFILPKFRMYKRCLAKILAENYVIAQGWSEERALGLARTVLKDNVDRIFPPRP